MGISRGGDEYCESIAAAFEARGGAGDGCRAAEGCNADLGAGNRAAGFGGGVQELGGDFERCKRSAGAGEGLCSARGEREREKYTGENIVRGFAAARGAGSGK